MVDAKTAEPISTRQQFFDDLPTELILSEFNKTLGQQSKMTQEIWKKGYTPHFHTAPHLTTADKAYQLPLDSDSLHQLETKWDQLVTLGLAKKLTLQEANKRLGFYSPSFTIKKKDGKKRRLINDLRRLNEHFVKKKHSLNGIREIMPLIRKDELMFTLDIKNGYYNVLIAKSHRHLFRFRVGIVVYELLALPMDLHTSMNIFNTWLRPVLTTIKQLLPGLQLHPYVDDILFRIPKTLRHLANHYSRQVLRILEILLIPVAIEKSNLQPRKRMHFLGFILNSKKMTLEVPPKKLRSLQKDLKVTFRENEKGSLTLGLLARTIGRLVSLLPAIPNAKLHMTHLYYLQNKLVRRRGWRLNTIAELSPSTRAELNWWLAYLKELKTYKLPGKFVTHEMRFVASDASKTNIAMVLMHESHSEFFKRKLMANEIPLSINVKEMLAVRDGLHHFQSVLLGRLVNLKTDNTSVMYGINKWGSKSPLLRSILQDIYAFCQRNDIMLTATYIPSSANSFADALSRDEPAQKHQKGITTILMQEEERRRGISWQISNQQIQHVHRILHLRPRKNLLSGLSHGGLSHVLSRDTIPSRFFTLNRRSVHFAFPNPYRITQYLHLLEASRLSAITILPVWPWAPWWNNAAHLAISPPIQIKGNLEARNQRRRCKITWAWIGVMLSGSKWKRSVYRRKFHTFNGASPLLPFSSTTQDGNVCEKRISATGAVLMRFMLKGIWAKH